ncbi:hypothetical protein [Tropicimonas sp. IMCC34011]|uniref:hypothetical protein n=1 Tax=Tropicimonas sp. IMCC34011 TaxID=2248759 RepID=UPI001300529B|nr:hypothetical protein [Tropicimonas sp. IMCC34011]
MIAPDQLKPVLLGSTILGAVAAGIAPDLMVNMASMNGPARVIEPRGGVVAAYHNRK